MPDRPVFLPNRDGHGAWVNSRALALAGHRRSAPLIPPTAASSATPPASLPACCRRAPPSLVSRLLPAATADDWDEALLAAQAHLLSLGITGWQDAIVGRDHGRQGADPLDAYLRAARHGTLVANVVGALWWDRNRGLEQLPELIERRDAGQAGRFRATSVKMMLDGIAESHTAAMLEPYLDGDGCATDHSGLDFIDPDELPRFVTALDREGFQVHFHALGDRAVRNALDAIEAARRAQAQDASARAAPPRAPSGRAPRRHPALRPAVGDRQHPAAVGDARAADGRADHPVPRRAPHRPGSTRSARCWTRARALCAGSDWPVSSPNPLWGAHVAVNRSLPADAGGHGRDPFLPGQALGPGRRSWPPTPRAAPGSTASTR